MSPEPRAPVPPGVAASQTAMQGGQREVCCQETVSLDSDSLRRQHCGERRVPPTPSRRWLMLGSQRWGLAFCQGRPLGAAWCPASFSWLCYQ